MCLCIRPVCYCALNYIVLPAIFKIRNQVEYGIRQLDRVLQVEMRELLKSLLDSNKERNLLDVRLRKEAAMHAETKSVLQNEVNRLQAAAERDKMGSQMLILNLEKKMQQNLSKIKVKINIGLRDRFILNR
jgi:hypothetical protein